MKLKISDECILCGACTVIEESKLEMGSDKIVAKGDYSKEKAKEIIGCCPVDAITEA